MTIRKKLRTLGIVALIVSIVVIGLGVLLSFLGWYGYRKWQYRVATTTIEESRQRRVFVKELHWQMDSSSIMVPDFHAWIEKGYHYGYQSEDQTVLWTNTRFPYQLRYGGSLGPSMTLLLRSDQRVKFDSSNLAQGFLTLPVLMDTIIIQLLNTSHNTPLIRIYE